ncbi:MAG TPA: sigma-70 family RNA polymerase sigma factor [Thermoanaerobaculia bacterium]
MTDQAQTGDPRERDAIARVKGGDRGAYDYLVSKYSRRAVSIAWGIVRNAGDAEDLAQEALVRGFQNIGRFRDGDPFGPWLFRIVTNLALDLTKHRRRVKHEELHESAPATRRDGAELGAVTGELARRIDAAIESLPENQRLVARLHLVEELSAQEIAAIMKLTDGTVRSHLSHARRKLQEQLSDLYGGSND